MGRDGCRCGECGEGRIRVEMGAVDARPCVDDGEDLRRREVGESLVVGA